MSAILVVASATVPDANTLSMLLESNWGNVSGWGLLLLTWAFVVIGSVRETWVPGARYRRLEDSSKRQSETLATTTDALRDQVRVNEITKHFFEETVPRRRDVQG